MKKFEKCDIYKSRRSKSIEIYIGNQSISIDLIRRLISEIDRNQSQKKNNLSIIIDFCYSNR